jgi:cell division protein FtsI (penicillin-binding protein 3)
MSDKKNIKEELFIYSIISFYIFLFFVLLFNNIINYNNNKNKIIKLGDILTSDKVVVGKNIKGYVYYIESNSIKNETEVNKFIHKHFKDYKIQNIYNNKCKFFLLGKKIHEINEDLPSGVILRRETFRYYPYGEIFAHPVGVWEENLSFGLENYNYKINKNLPVNEIKPVKTSLIFSLQYYLYEGMKKGMSTYKSEKIHGIIQNEKGEIVALVSLPNFNPNNHKNIINTNNGVVNNIFEFGSTIKVFSFLCGLDKNLINEKTQFNLSEGGRIGNHKISDVRKNSGYMTVEDIFTKSSNIGTIQMSELIWNHIGDFFNNLLLGEKIEFENYSTPTPYLKTHNQKKHVLQHFSIGYSFSTGMLQVLRAFACIFTGNLYNPSIIKTPNNKSSFIRSFPINNKHLMLKMLLRNSETNPVLKKNHVYGKTGTARVIIKGTYIVNLVNTFYLCSFTKNNERYFMLLIMEKPRKGPFEASGNVKHIAAKIIANIVKSN